MPSNSIEKVRGFDPCLEGWEWLREQKSLKQAWADCQRGDWMLWYLERIKYGEQITPEDKDIWSVVKKCVAIMRKVHVNEWDCSYIFIHKGWKHPWVDFMDDPPDDAELPALAKCADIVRKYCPKIPYMRAK